MILPLVPQMSICLERVSRRHGTDRHPVPVAGRYRTVCLDGVRVRKATQARIWNTNVLTGPRRPLEGNHHAGQQRTHEGRKIADAVRAAPAFIADSATVLDWDMTTVLREGSPDWICVPTPPGKPQPAPMCGDPTIIQWLKDVEQGKTPAIDRMGISYMLLGEVGIAPHVMFVFPQGADRILTGLADDTTGTAVCWPATPDRVPGWPKSGAEPLLVVPIALPGERVCGCPSGALVAATARPHPYVLPVGL